LTTSCGPSAWLYIIPPLLFVVDFFVIAVLNALIGNRGRAFAGGSFGSASSDDSSSFSDDDFSGDGGDSGGGGASGSW